MFRAEGCSSSASVTCAPETGFPAGSYTQPKMEPVVTWAQSGHENRINKKTGNFPRIINAVSVSLIRAPAKRSLPLRCQLHFSFRSLPGRQSGLAAPIIGVKRFYSVRCNVFPADVPLHWARKGQNFSHSKGRCFPLVSLSSRWCTLGPVLHVPVSALVPHGFGRVGRCSAAVPGWGLRLPRMHFGADWWGPRRPPAGGKLSAAG